MRPLTTSILLVVASSLWLLLYGASVLYFRHTGQMTHERMEGFDKDTAKGEEHSAGKKVTTKIESNPGGGDYDAEIGSNAEIGSKSLEDGGGQESSDTVTQPTVTAPTLGRPPSFTSPPVNLANGGYLEAPSYLTTTSSPVLLSSGGYVIRTKRSVARSACTDTESAGMAFIFLSALLGLATVVAYLINLRRGPRQLLTVYVLASASLGTNCLAAESLSTPGSAFSLLLHTAALTYFLKQFQKRYGMAIFHHGAAAPEYRHTYMDNISDNLFS